MGAPVDDPRIQRFFSSLILGKNLEGTEVRDGLGAESPSTQVSPVLRTTELDRKPVVLTRPEARYTESARQGRITGVIVLKAVFGSNGRVTDIEIVSGLPNGLNDQALKAAKQIRFVPGVKGGNLASCSLQLEYYFNIY
jgi:TonB family protein